MCGIYGITQKNEQFIQNYINQCSHRGPDGQGIWSNDKITLGHNLLSITDQPSNSKQPWITPQGNILIYNGEIFNYPDLVRRYTTSILGQPVTQNYWHGVGHDMVSILLIK
jgi:asparagine synthase (glutamine-hydrolysing)